MNEALDLFFKIVDPKNTSTKKRLEFRLNRCFKDINLDKKRVLDIGGGNGLFSFYAALMGAKEVVCLEPEDAGSTTGVIETFNNFKESLNLDKVVKLESQTLQDFSSSNNKFDIILLYNSINHLDEEACINLQTDYKSREIYNSLFQKISDLSTSDSKIIIADCSRYNLFPLFGMKNPFMRSIEWHKHQSPKFWAGMLSKFGFQNARITWNSFNRMGSVGSFVLGNKFTSFFLNSHFRLVMSKE